MKFNIVALFVLCVFVADNLSAQEMAIIKGTVKDARTEEYLPWANVFIKDTPIGSATDNSGRFIIKNTVSGTYTIICSYVGYATVNKTITVSSGKTVILDFSLVPTGFQGEEIVIAREMLLGGTSKITGIPGSAHFISQKELAKYNYSDIHRVLRTIPGINIQEEDGYGLRPNIGMRGTGVERSQKINLMEDGILIAPAPYSAPAAYYFPTVGRMQEIEVRKGSSQIKYGPYTTGGALNLISTRIPFEFGGRFNITVGENNSRGIHANVGDSYKNFGFLVESYQLKVDGFKQLDGGGNTGFDKKDYMVKLRLNSDISAKLYQSLSIKLSQTDEVSHETYLGLMEADFAKNPYRRYAGSQLDLMDAQHKQFTASYFIKPSNSFDVTTTLYRNEFSRNWYKLDRVRATTDGTRKKIADILANPTDNIAEYAIITGATSSNNNALEVKANNREYLSQGIQSIVGIEFGKEESALHQIELGMRYHEDEMDRFQWVDTYKMDTGNMRLTNTGTPGTESNRIHSAKAWAYFIQYKYKKGKFIAMPGIRYENMTLIKDDYGKTDPNRTGSDLKSHKNDVSTWIPGIGIDYSFTPQLSTFAGIHKGFSPPGSRKGTKPEISINYEMGMRFKNNGLNTQLILFFNNYDNLLGADLAGAGGSGSGDLFNGGAVDIKGIEYALNSDLGWALNLARYSIPIDLAYTYTVSEYKNSFASDFGPWGEVQAGDELPYLQRHQFTLSIGLSESHWNINISGKYVSKIRTEAGRGSIITEKSIAPRFIFDASAEYTLTQKNKIFITIRNITDKAYITARRPAGVRPGLPRTFLMGIKTDF